MIRFHHAADWDAVLLRHPSVFGERDPSAERRRAAPPDEPPPPAEPDFDPELFEEPWLPLLEALASTPGVTVDGGGEVESGGRVVGQFEATVHRDGRTLLLVADDGAQVGPCAEALAAQGRRVLRVAPGDVSRIDEILETLGREA